MAYIGNAPIIQSTRSISEFTATASQTTFTPVGGYTVGAIDVQVNGVTLGSDDFTATNGTTVVLASGAAAGDLVRIVSFNTFNVANINGSAIMDGTIATSELANGAVTTAKLADSSVTVAKISATGTPSSSTVLRGDGVWGTVSAVDVQTFDASGTWTKPAAGSVARIQVWGGGGGAGRGTSSTARQTAGGGGGYNEIIVPLSSLASTVSVTVGSGGSGRTGSTGNGTAGGNSSFGTLVYAYGGGAGVGTSSAVNIYWGGGGGGQLSAGANSGTSGVFVSPFTYSHTENPINGKPWFNAYGFGISPSDNTTPVRYPVNPSPFHGGIGLGAEFVGSSTGSMSSAAKDSLYGGGGGGHVHGGLEDNYGRSVFGGNGGITGATGGNGSAPAGGGAASNTAAGNGGNGAAGRVVVTVW